MPRGVMDMDIEQDICTDISNKARFATPKRQSVAYLAFIGIELLPFVFYFWFNEPHDCFKCLGKDPERRYSIFQLTERENLIRDLSVKYGSGAFGMAGTLKQSEQLSDIVDYEQEQKSRARSMIPFGRTKSASDRNDLILVRVRSSSKQRDTRTERQTTLAMVRSRSSNVDTTQRSLTTVLANESADHSVLRKSEENTGVFFKPL